jgi:hypothetical protein
MAVIRFDSKTLAIDVLVGIEENYKPNKKIKDLVKKVNKLKEDTNSYLMEKYSTVDGQKILEILKTNVELQNEWKEYLVNVYNVEMQKLINEIENINKKLCSNYEDFINTKSA